MNVELKCWQLWYAEDAKNLAYPQTEQELQNSGFQSFPVEAPCNFEYELQKQGVLKDLYVGENVFEAQKYEYYHQWYSTKFDSPFEKTELVFKGIDTIADIFVNGKLIGKADNMFIPHTFVLEDLKAKGNDLIVHIYPALKVAENYNIGAGEFAFDYNWASLPIRKSPQSYGWDIFPRLVGGGLWRKVFLQEYKENELIENYLYTCNLGTDVATLGLFFKFRCEKDAKDHEIEVYGVCGDSVIHESRKAWHTYGCMLFEQKNPKLWWPRNEGEQNLYDVVVSLKKDGKVLDQKSFKFGIRTTKLEKTSQALPNGKFEFYVNGRKIFINGVNWVPLDAVESKAEQRLEKALNCMYDVGANMVRVWGGGYYESEAFYDYCDEKGVLVWQDFMMGCAVYPQNQEFAERLRFEAETIVKALRGHASIALWSGDNECDCAYNWGKIPRDPNVNMLTRKVLPEAIRKHDPARDYLPSSPYMDEKLDWDLLPECHLWWQDLFFKERYYKHPDCQFISETGYLSLPSIQSLREFLVEPDRLYEENGEPSNEYLAHITSMGKGVKEKYAFRFPFLFQHAKDLFGYVPENLEDFVKMDQIAQAEAYKFFIERMRILRKRNGGIILWNLIDGYTQISDAFVDYYFRKKQSYYYVKRSQQPLCFMFGENLEGLPLYVVNELISDLEVSYKVTDLATGETVLQGEVTAKNHEAQQVAKIPEYKLKKTFYLIEWQTKDGLIQGKNHYYALMPGIDYNEYLAFMEKAGFEDFE